MYFVLLKIIHQDGEKNCKKHIGLEIYTFIITQIMRLKKCDIFKCKMVPHLTFPSLKQVEIEPTPFVQVLAPPISRGGGHCFV